MLVSSISGVGLGTFQEGECPDADFVCGPKTHKGKSIYSCRPCDFAQLIEFRRLQTMANSLVVALGMVNKPGIITGLHSCSGGDIVAVDERIGPCTKRTITRIVSLFGPKTMKPINPLLSVSKFQSTYEYIAHVTPELITYFQQLIQITSAPKNVPAPVQQPVQFVDAPGPVPGPDPLPPPPPNGLVVRPRVSKSGLLIGVLAALTAIGLVGTGIYYRRRA